MAPNKTGHLPRRAMILHLQPSTRRALPGALGDKRVVRTGERFLAFPLDLLPAPPGSRRVVCASEGRSSFLAKIVERQTPVDCRRASVPSLATHLVEQPALVHELRRGCRLFEQGRFGLLSCCRRHILAASLCGSGRTIIQTTFDTVLPG